MEKILYNEFVEATKINPFATTKSFEAEQLQYIVIDRLLQNPENMIKYLDKFPALDKEDFRKNGKVISYAPGLQQLIPANCLQDLTMYFTNLLHPIIGKKFRIEWYTNIFSPDMIVTETSRYPHIDTFDLAINIWLTENQDGDGTAFYKSQNNLYYGEPVKYDFSDDEEEVWKRFEGNNDYKKYLVIPSKYNSAVVYNGKFYHSAYYIPNENKERKSLVGGLFVL